MSDNVVRSMGAVVLLLASGCGGGQRDASEVRADLSAPMPERSAPEPAAPAPAPAPSPADEPPPRLDGPVAYHCFDVRWADGDRNSECVRDGSQCERDLASMRGYATPDAVFRGCFPVSSAYCYDATTELCFVKMSDCVQSHDPIPGGPCEVRR